LVFGLNAKVYSPVYLVKERLQTCESSAFEELRENISEILSSIVSSELEKVMRAWMHHLQKGTDLDGESV
jgi:septum formation topological specificity factor MinE